MSPGAVRGSTPPRRGPREGGLDEARADAFGGAGDKGPHGQTATATQVVVRVTPSMMPMPSVTSRPIESMVGPSTTAMKS